MALPSSHSTNDNLTYSKTSLVPLRVNVVSDDKTVCIVDTMILDRSCWPAPLFYPLEDAIERNAEELAYSLLTDMEVQGMGRTTRHFTGRVDLWSASTFQKIVEQLRPQLRQVAKTTKIIPERVVASTKRKEAVLTGDKDNANESSSDDNNNKSDKQQPTTEQNPAPPHKKAKKQSLIPIKLRLCVNGIRIHDDFIWDLQVPQCPIEFAQSLGKDLNLPEEAVVAIVTSLVEQLDGAVVEDTKDLLDAATTAGTSVRKHATAAWHLDNKAHIANIEQLLMLHRPNLT